MRLAVLEQVDFLEDIYVNFIFRDDTIALGMHFWIIRFPDLIGEVIFQDCLLNFVSLFFGVFANCNTASVFVECNTASAFVTGAIGTCSDAGECQASEATSRTSRWASLA